MTITYRAVDGKIFENIDDCLDHERFLFGEKIKGHLQFCDYEGNILYYADMVDTIDIYGIHIVDEKGLELYHEFCSREGWDVTISDVGSWYWDEALVDWVPFLTVITNLESRIRSMKEIMKRLQTFED